MVVSVDYFRNLLKIHTNKLNELCDKWSEELKSDKADQIPDQAIGTIRSTIGQATLLMSQRFKQFNGLIDDCEFNRGEKEVKFDDLQGFWDMIYLQVEDVERKFNNLDKLKSNQWVEEENVVSMKIKKPRSKPKVKSLLKAVN